MKKQTQGPALKGIQCCDFENKGLETASAIFYPGLLNPFCQTIYIYKAFNHVVVLFFSPFPTSRLPPHLLSPSLFCRTLISDSLFCYTCLQVGILQLTSAGLFIFMAFKKGRRWGEGESQERLFVKNVVNFASSIFWLEGLLQRKEC